jgi:tetratricopeptide (TPR) repeat protein
MMSVLAFVAALLIPFQQPDHCAVVSDGRPSLPAKLMTGMGESDFPITTASPEAQAFFNQGVSQLYAFWFGEAERSFMQAAAIDPSAGMAYWGIAMAAPGDFKPAYQNALNPLRRVPLIPSPGSGESRAREAIAKARELKSKLTERERLYIDAVAARRNPRARNAEADYVDLMRKLAGAFPNDTNARAILALAIDNGYETVTRKPRTGTEESITLLKEILRELPDHVGAHHFLMHAYEDSPRAVDAWASSEHYPKLVSNIPHALHMPGHIYAQTGRFEDALKAFEIAGANEHSYMDADPLYPPDHYLHNQQFLIYVLGALGRYRDAINESRKLIAVPENARERDALEGSSFYRTGWFSLMRTLVRFEKWDEILDGATLPFYNKPREASWYYWARALASAAQGNRANAVEALRNMEAMLDRLKRLLNLIPAQLYVARAEADAAVSADPAAIERMLALEADMLYTDPPTYPRPFLESAGRRALRNRDFKTAEVRYRKLLEREPGSGRALSGLAEALAGEGKTSEAESVRADFRKAWAHADSAP